MNNNKKHFSNYIVILSIIMIVGFTVCAFVLQFVTKMEVSSTLIISWFSFWTVEVSALALIKTNKVKNNKKKE